MEIGVGVERGDREGEQNETGEETSDNGNGTDSPQGVVMTDEGDQKIEEDTDSTNEEAIFEAKCEENPKERTRKYLEENGILRMFQNLAARIVHDRPENPLQYMIQNLEEANKDS